MDAIAPTEGSTTANAAHAKGSYFFYGGVLYVAMADIAPGETIITSGSGQNCEEAPLGKTATELKSAIDGITTATEDNEGKALKAKTIVNGKVTEWEFGEAGGGISSDVKSALLACFAKVTWTDEHGQDYYDALESALYPVELVSIGAVYTQTATVYSTNSLNSLKSDLIVTAYYNNGTSSIINAYSLSGTLVEGTSTITVTYDGKTTTFNVIVTADAAMTYALPQPATFTGTGSDVINTNVVLLDTNHDFSVVLSFTPDTPTGKEALFYAGNTHDRVAVQCTDTGIWYVAASSENSDKRYEMTNIVAQKENRIVMRRKVGTWVEVFALGGDGDYESGGPVAYGNIVTNSAIRIGGGFREGGDINYYYKGIVSVCKVYNRYLSDDEVNNFLYGES